MLKVYVQTGGADESRPPQRKVVLVRRILLLATVVVMMAVIVVAMAAGPVLAGNSFAKGRGPAGDCEINCNPGEDVSEPKGDTKNDVANPQCFDQPSKSPNGIGCNNN
jgi:hypothetical protein